jgi:hypothetical protein
MLHYLSLSWISYCIAFRQHIHMVVRVEIIDDDGFSSRVAQLTVYGRDLF